MGPVPLKPAIAAFRSLQTHQQHRISWNAQAMKQRSHLMLSLPSRTAPGEGFNGAMRVTAFAHPRFLRTDDLMDQIA